MTNHSKAGKEALFCLSYLAGSTKENIKRSLIKGMLNIYSNVTLNLWHSY